MTKDEAAIIVRVLATTLRDNPHQFTINVNVIGQQITSHGGTGMSVSVTGGAAGTTVGQQVSAAGGSFSLQQGQASAAVHARMLEIAAGLDEIASQLEGPTPNSATIWSRVRALGQSWLPGIVQSVLGNLLTLALIAPPN